MRLTLRPPTGRSVVQVDADGVPGASRVLNTLNAPTYTPLPSPTPRWSLASLALRALAGSLDKLELELDAPTLGLAPRADVLADLLSEEEEDPRVWSALALAYGPGVEAVRRMPLSDAHLFALPQPVVLDFSAPGMPFDDGAALSLLAADLRALVLLDLSGQPALTDRGLLTLARAQGTSGVRALALRGCAGVGVEGVRACAMAWERLEVLDIRGTGYPSGTAIPGFAPRPPAHIADSRFHPRSPEQIARALLGKDVPFILVDEEDFGRRPARRVRQPVVERAVVPAVEPQQPAPRVFTSSLPASGVLLVERPPPLPPPPVPEPATLPPEPTTMDELRARRLAAFGGAPPARPAPQPEPCRPAPPLLPPAPAPAPAPHPPASAWTRAPRRDMVLWDDILARHQPRPAPRASLSIPKSQRLAAAAPAAPAAPPPAKRWRESNAYSVADGNPYPGAGADLARPSSSADVPLAIPSSNTELAQPAKRTKPRASQAVLTEKYEARARARQDRPGPRPAPRASLAIPKEERMAASAPPQPSSSHSVGPAAKRRRVASPHSSANMSAYVDADDDAYFDAESDAGSGSAISEPGPYVYIDPDAYSSDEGSEGSHYSSDWKPHFWTGSDAYSSDEGSDADPYFYTDAQPARPPPMPQNYAPPAKRARVANPYSRAGANATTYSGAHPSSTTDAHPYSTAAPDSKLANPGKQAQRAEKDTEKAALAERARFAARLADEGALMFVRVAPPPPLAPSSSSAAQKQVEVKVKVRANEGVRAHLAGLLRPRAAASGVGAGASASTGPASASGSTASASAEASVSAEVPQAARRVPFARASVSGARRGLSTWHGVAPAEEEEGGEDEVVEVSRETVLQSARLNRKVRAGGAKSAVPTTKPAAKSTTSAAKPSLSAPKPSKSTAAKPAPKPKMPSLNSSGGGGAKQARQTTLSFAKKPPASSKGKG